MSQKRFSLKEWEDLNYCEHCFYDGESLLSDSDVVVLLNKQQATISQLKEENEQLKQKIQRWKTLYEIKDKEVTARVKRLNEICNQYKYAITFDKDIDPNDAVNILCDRILQTEVEMW